MRKTLSTGLLALLLSACGGYDTVIIAPPGNLLPPSIGVGVSGAANLTRASTAEVTVTVFRPSGFSGSIDLSAERLPAGVTAAFVPATVPSNSSTSTLTLSATTTATLGTVTAAVRARATGMTDAEAPLVIGVNP